MSDMIARTAPRLRSAQTKVVPAMWWLGLALAAAGAVTIAVALARSSFELPRPTGPLPVGTIAFDVPASDGAGTVAVRLWYPGHASGSRAPYEAGPGFTGWIYRHIVGTHAAPNVELATLPKSAPVLIYVASWGGKRSDNTALLEDLASHGFVVAAIGDIRFDDPPDAALSAPADFTSAAADAATRRLAHEKLLAGARRISDVLAYLTMLNRHDPDRRFEHRLDMQRVGVLGYSFGGAVAFYASRHDPRIAAAMNLDGWLFDAARDGGRQVPYFLVSDRAPLPGPAELDATDPVLRYTSRLTLADEQIQREVLRAGGFALRIEGAHHLSFSDVPLYAPLQRFASGRVDPASISGAVRAYAVAFFTQTLLGEAAPLLVPGEKQAPALTLERWPVGGQKEL